MDDDDKILMRDLARDNFMAGYLTGFAAACCAEMVAYPFDLTKTRLQLQGEATSSAGAGPQRGMIGIGMDIVQKEGFFKLYSGLSAMVLRHSIFTGLKMILYDGIRDLLIIRDKDGKTQFPVWRSSICGIAAGALACVVSSPTDLIKVQMQVESKRRLMGLPPRIHNVGQAFMDIYKKGGIRALWKGTIPNAQRAALVTMGDVSFYDVSKRKIRTLMGKEEDNLFIQFTSAMFAGLASVALSCPVDVVKSRVMNQPVDDKGRGLNYKNSMDCFFKLIKEEGVLAMYKGALPYWLRLGPWSLVFWMSLEEIRRLTGQGDF